MPIGGSKVGFFGAGVSEGNYFSVQVYLKRIILVMKV